MQEAGEPTQVDRARYRRISMYGLGVGIALAASGVGWKLLQVCGFPGKQVCEEIPGPIAALPVVLMVAGVLLVMGTVALILALREAGRP